MTGSPSWTDWGPYLTGDYVARGIKRRLLFHSDERHSSIAASFLRDTISMFTRNFTKQNVVIAVAGTTVALRPGFLFGADDLGQCRLARDRRQSGHL